MGVGSNISGRIRDWFGTDKQSGVEELKRGETVGATRIGSGDIGSQSGYDALSDTLRIDSGLLQRYSDYEEMDDYPEIGSALDIYGDDATIPDANHNKAVWVTSPDKVVREVLTDLFDKRLRLEEDVYGIARTLAKYGNVFGEILANESGVVGINYMPTPSVRRMETTKGSLVGYIQDPSGRFSINQSQFSDLLAGKVEAKGVVAFEPWEVVHWRMSGKQVRSSYGHSVLDSARWVWRRLVMAEDSALVYKLTRAPARFAFYVDVGDMPPAQAVAYVNQVKQQYKRRKMFRPGTGKLDFRSNPLSQDEDFWIPTRAGQHSTSIDVISGPDYQAVEDLEYFRGKLFSAIKVPRSYLGFGGEGSSRAALSQEDVRFARTVMRLQREIRNGLKEVCRVHLAALNIDPDQIDFDVRMTIPSAIFELAQLELQNARADAADRLATYFPKDWLLQNVFEFSQDDALYVLDQKKAETKATARDDAETQQELMKDFPDVAQAGMLEPAPIEPMAADVSDVLSRLDELDRRNRIIEATTRAVANKLDEIKPIVKDTQRGLRVKQPPSRRRTG